MRTSPKKGFNSRQSLHFPYPTSKEGRVDMVSTTILLALFTSKLPLELPTQAILLLPLLVIERGVSWIIDLISMRKTKGI